MKLNLPFKQYKYSVYLYLFLAFFVFIYNIDNLFNEIKNIFASLNIHILVYMPLVIFLGSFSFILPFKTFAHIRKHKMPFIETIKICIIWAYLNIVGKNGDAYFLDYFKIDKSERKKVFGAFRIMDYMAIIIVMSVTLPFIYSKNVFYLLIYLILIPLIAFLFYKDLRYLPKDNSIKYLFASIFKYPIESIVPLFLLLSFSFEITIPLVLFFTSSTCILYYIPRFKLAGGLITLYLMIYTYFLGKGILLGFVVATVLRIASLLFFVLPIIFLKLILAGFLSHKVS